MLGGTFNPPHMGHMTMAQSAFELYDLSKVVFIPSSRPPHKEAAPVLSAEHRAAMLELVLDGDIRFELSRIEMDRPGPSYTIDTVRQFREDYPGMELFFIIGTDSLLELHLWKNIEELLTLCRFISFERPGVPAESLTPGKLQLPPPWPEKLLADVARGIRVDISSSELRYRVAEGFSIKYLVPPDVEMYIAEHSLYQA